MTYRQTLEYLYEQLPMFQRIGAAAYKADLGNTLAMCSMLGNPENGFRSIHIAGTNGKGSTSHLIASVLQCAGYKTGLYTSPHLKDFRERIKINGKKISRSYITGFVHRNKNQFEPVKPSFFEYTAVMAFQYFKDEQVDIAVIETGMGGRLDSTNVITPVVSVITNISKDHMAYLGSTLQAIAGEKAGIIKAGVPVVIGETQPEIKDVFYQRAETLSAPLLFADQNFRLQKNNDKSNCFFIVPGDGIPMECPLKGIYQEKNLVTGYQVLQVLKDNDYEIHNEDIRSGFRKVIRLTGLRGRWQVLGRKPKIICDVGHNEAGIKYVLEQLRTEKYANLHWVFGMVNDKDADQILSLLPLDARYYFCKPNIPRGLDAGELQQKAKAVGLKGSSYPSVRTAYDAARNAATQNDLVFIGGSTFIVAEVL